eukprot:5913818-Alexandrium_andersonii.AAC.1
MVARTASTTVALMRLWSSLSVRVKCASGGFTACSSLSRESSIDIAFNTRVVLSGHKLSGYKLRYQLSTCC